MKGKSKYQKRNKKSRDCTKCKKFGGMISKNYFICKAEMYKDQPHSYDIYDRDVLHKGTCNMFVPKEIDQDDHIHDHDAMDREKQTDLILIPYKE